MTYIKFILSFLIFLILPFNLCAKTFSIATYNVENLFDLQKQGSEYKEYIPNTKSKWNKYNFNIKLNNTIRVINDIDADIIALQEIENKQIMHLLQKKMPRYTFKSFAKYKKSSVGIGILSKIKIISNKKIDVKFRNKTYRPILETTFELDKIRFKIFNNHWASKRVPESYRIKFAYNLQNRLKQLSHDYDYILLGDFNSNYNEYKTIIKDKKLNNTSSITGINHILNTTKNKKFITFDDILKDKQKVHYNLWLETQALNRFSAKYKNRNITPDNILLPASLFDTKKISYIPNSFRVFKAKYLFQKQKIIRWKMYKNIHKGYGYSDHLPIIAKFSTNSDKQNPLQTLLKRKINKVSKLYKKTKLIKSIVLKDMIVIYKTNNSAIVKQKNDRAIYFYQNAQRLKEGFSYDLEIVEIQDYEDLKEVKKYTIVKSNGEYKDITTLYIDANEIDIFEAKYQNEIIKNLQGTYKQPYLYIKNQKYKKIRLYAKNNYNLPKQKENIIIKQGHLGIYKGNVQVVIHSNKDYEVVK